MLGVVFLGAFLAVGTLLVTAGAAPSDRLDGAAMLAVAPAVSWLIWVRPYLLLTDEQVVVRNALVACAIPLADVVRAEAGGWGVLIEVRGRRAPVTAMAVAKSNISFMTGRRTRADHVADAITQSA